MPGRRLRIQHRTGYRYASPVVSSFNEVRMTPLDDDGQVLIAHELRVEPRAAVLVYTDYWGARVESFDTHEPHDVLEVIATSTVDTAGGYHRATGTTWEELAGEKILDRWCEYLVTSSYVDDAREDDHRAGLVDQLRGCPTPADAVHLCNEMVRDRMSYAAGATTVSTTASEAWEAGSGVCQDFTHAMLSLLRSTGIPARYVSGYLHTEEEVLGETVRGESHAWVEVWNGGWEGLDPTNDRTVGAAHVLVARGRDYADVPPLKGIYAGGASQGLGVEVEITQLRR
ncbi:MAG: transglutaminase family protein [Actinobacteria bacterium]|nr:transglutaminase family protein [Actinomycetota bacterium]MCB8997107.1 transglutaminase family protein [Actinomycetota bacterium]MCB9415316.1 transglutaminase family protein [Actinomycetota bacterium]MCB9424808.1 transglutaminase family protein [Actinomycetota bacterium]HRY09442.1 transglutaminase family protein [Candidatus Nanopelagicales bacterium]